MKETIIVGLPAYNEQDALPKLLPKLEQLSVQFGEAFRVVVVNDGSSDGTAGVLKEACRTYAWLQVIDHERNRGLGEAMNTLVRFVTSEYQPSDVLVTLDADNTHNPNLIPALVAKLKENKLDLVVASRFARGGQELGLSFLRRLYSRGAMVFFKLFFPIEGVHDYSSGFRAYRIGYLNQAMNLYKERLITTSGFDCMAEMMARFSKIGIKAGEYPLVLEYHLKVGRSKMNVKRTIAGYFRLLMKVKPPVQGTQKKVKGTV
ncbi:glycosyltransferase family 2 protein [Paenibacillus chitinolyticus]|uniref:glycosyltransferase family 2 protein n=1 Tax=Paenibacillus TaxID=44249 RepID=UPI001C48F844|nr:glycosyltransferase family 2 protein [Paenibacillus chitinolyticus]MBV6713006.1 glycosyltransferase family 2 protein [Paenibacillus chitinolyticus]